MGTDQSGMELPDAPLPTVPPKAIKAILDSMIDLDKKHVPMLFSVFGEQGTGKTKAGMEILQRVTDPDKKIVYVDTAMNFATLNNHPDLRRRVKVMEYENIEQLLILAQAIRTQPALRNMIGAVIIDEYSSAVKADRKWIVRSRSEQAKPKYKDPHHPSQADYLSSQIRSEEVIQAFLASGIHACFISHEKVDEKVVTRPDFAPGAANDFQRLIHGVYRATTKVENGHLQWQLQLQPTGRISVKNRIGGLGVFATAEQVAEAYHRWGIENDTPTETAVTPAEAETIAKEDNALLELLKD
jgi:hypothetical protein